MRRPAESPFAVRTVAWITSISAISFLLAFVLAGFGDDLSSPRSAGNDAFSYSAVGHRAFVAFLEEIGLPATVRRSPAAALGPGVPLLALEPTENEDGGASMTQLTREAREAETDLFVALAKWRGVPKPLRPTWVDQVEPLGTDAILDELGLKDLALDVSGDESVTFECESEKGELLRVELRRARFFTPSTAFEPVVRCGDRVLLARVSLPEGPTVYVLSDPDVLNNQGIHRADHGLLLAGVLRDSMSAGQVVIDEMHHGFVHRVGLLAELLRFPLVIAVTHGLMLIGVVVWAGARRVGKPLPPPGVLRGGKVSLIDNAAQLLAGSGHSIRSVRRYFEQSLRGAGAHFFLPTELAHDELVDRLQQITESRGVRFDLRGAERRAAALQPSAGSAERSVRLAMDIYRWREELTNGTRTDP